MFISILSINITRKCIYSSILNNKITNRNKNYHKKCMVNSFKPVFYLTEIYTNKIGKSNRESTRINEC